MNIHPDSINLSSFRSGDETAFREVFNTYYRQLYYFANKLIANKEDAEEIVQNCFIKLFQRCTLFETAANIKAFLFVTARNNCFDHLRAARVQKEKQREFITRMQDDSFFQLEYEIKDELIEMVRHAINALPDECRKIFKMLYFEEMTPAEVAQILHISVNTVYVQRSRAVKSLRLALSDHPMVVAWLVIATAYMQAG